MLKVLISFAYKIGITGVVTKPLLHVLPLYPVPSQLHWKDCSPLVIVVIGRQIPPFWQGLGSHGLAASVMESNA